MGNVTNVLSGTFDFISFSFVPSQGFFGGGFIYLNVSIFRAVIVLTAPATAELPPRWPTSIRWGSDDLIFLILDANVTEFSDDDDDSEEEAEEEENDFRDQDNDLDFFFPCDDVGFINRSWSCRGVMAILDEKLHSTPDTYHDVASTNT